MGRGGRLCLTAQSLDRAQEIGVFGAGNQPEELRSRNRVGKRGRMGDGRGEKPHESVDEEVILPQIGQHALLGQGARGQLIGEGVAGGGLPVLGAERFEVIGGAHGLTFQAGARRRDKSLPCAVRVSGSSTGRGTAPGGGVTSSSPVSLRMWMAWPMRAASAGS